MLLNRRPHRFLRITKERFLEASKGYFDGGRWIEMKTAYFTTILLFTCALSVIRAENAGPLAIPTFHCIGLYWSPPGGVASKEVQVRYRRQGAADWKDAL